jgi:hypothetical protein
MNEEELDTKAEASFTPTGCDSGIKRWTSSSNSIATWKKARKASGKWSDPEFGAD